LLQKESCWCPNRQTNDYLDMVCHGLLVSHLRRLFKD
jgi:hypothetical protein